MNAIGNMTSEAKLSSSVWIMSVGGDLNNFTHRFSHDIYYNKDPHLARIKSLQSHLMNFLAS